MKEAFLVLESHKVRIVPTLADAIRLWMPSTRLSPIYLHSQTDGSQSLSQAFEGAHVLFLLGPVAPWIVLERVGAAAEVWLTLGSFNVLVHLTAVEGIDPVLAWVVETGLNFELWHIENGVIVRRQYSTPRQCEEGTWRNDIAEFSCRPVPPELDELIKEYCPLMASALARAEQVLPEIVPDLLSVNKYVEFSLSRKNEEPLSAYTYNGLKMLTLVNAGLSRFTSQAFSGTSPVSETECHFWTHSLLGTAVANIALWRFCRFVFKVLGEQAIPSRFAGLRSTPAPKGKGISNLGYDDEIWYRDHLSSVEVEKKEAVNRFPPITFFSGRDGFKSTLYGVSAPLAIIGACNSKRWTLLTLTHEISHNVVRALLGKVYPRPIDSELDNACSLVKGEPRTLLEALQQYLFMTVFAMQQLDARSVGLHINRETARYAFDRWHHEVEEILVHIFDFLYFYEGDCERYVRGIWLSWSVIPNIGNRVPEYVMRTLCAVLALHLRRGPETEAATRDQVRTVLEGLVKIGDGAQYISQAIACLDGQWEELQRALVARRGLVRVVRGFVYSESIAVQLWRDRQAGGGGRGHQGYSFRSLQFLPEVIENPLRFVDGYTTSAHPSSLSSLWMLYMLAFNAGEQNG